MRIGLVFNPEASAVSRNAFSSATRFAHKLTKKQTRLPASQPNSMFVYVNCWRELLQFFAGCFTRLKFGVFCDAIKGRGAVSAGMSAGETAPLASCRRLLAGFFGLGGQVFDGFFINPLVAGVELFDVFLVEVLEFFV